MISIIIDSIYLPIWQKAAFIAIAEKLPTVSWNSPSQTPRQRESHVSVFPEER